MELHKGDLFCTRNPMWLGKAINVCQSAMSRDGKSLYSHSGIIIDNKGTTFEALHTIKSQNLFESYADEQVVAARWIAMSDEVFDYVFPILKKEHDGKLYPYWRLPLNIIPFVAKYTTFRGKFVVCSELVAKFLYYVFIYFGHTTPAGYQWPRHKWFTGTNPDTLSDEWHRWQEYEIVFEGTLPTTLNNST